MAKPATTDRSRKAIKTAGIVLLSLIGFLLVSLVTLYFLAEPLVARYIKKQVNQQTNGLYQIQFSDLQLHLRTSSVTLQELHFYPDTAVNRQQKENGQASMSRKGNCWDNAVAESFFKTLKTELVYHRKFTTRQEAWLAVFEYILGFYNRERRHSALGYLTPCQYEERLYKQRMAA